MSEFAASTPTDFERWRRTDRPDRAADGREQRDRGDGCCEGPERRLCGCFDPRLHRYCGRCDKGDACLACQWDKQGHASDTGIGR